MSNEQALTETLKPGDHGPTFNAGSTIGPTFDSSAACGHFSIVSFPGPAQQPFGSAVVDAFIAVGPKLATVDYMVLVMSFYAADREDPRFKRLGPRSVGIWDADGQIHVKYRAIIKDPGDGSPRLRPVTYVLDPNMRVIAAITEPDPVKHVTSAVQILVSQTRQAPPHPATPHAPVLMVPNVFERELCQRLITGYEKNGGKDSGFMQDRGGKTTLVIDHQFKRRSDWAMNDLELILEVKGCIERRLIPEIEKAFNFKATRIERYLVACYSAETGGYFRPHRDNTTKGTAHRRFAVTFNLNSEDYTGGELMFPEYGRMLYRAPTGGAVVFGCGLLHEATPVRTGLRYAFLPFLYDEAAADLREANNEFLDDKVMKYKAARLTEAEKPEVDPEAVVHAGA